MRLCITHIGLDRSSSHEEPWSTSGVLDITTVEEVTVCLKRTIAPPQKVIIDAAIQSAISELESFFQKEQ